MKKFLKCQDGVIGIVAALIIAASAGAIIAADNPKVVKVINNDILHKNDPNYEVPANPSPSKNR